jgi:hypothetical protein
MPKEPLHPKIPCMFCGSTLNKSSREHTWPDWIVQRYPKDYATFWASYVDGRLVYTKKADSISWVVRGVCLSCNTGWMSTLEKEVEPILVKLIEGPIAIISADQCEVLSRWCFKTTITLGMKKTPGTIPVEHAQYLHEFQRPPDSTLIWLMRYGENDHNVAHFSVGLNGHLFRNTETTPMAVEHGFRSGSYGYLSSIRIRHFLCQIFWGEEEEFTTAITSQSFDRGIRPLIFPGDGAATIWPQGQINNRLEMEEFMNRYSGRDVINPVTRILRS